MSATVKRLVSTVARQPLDEERMKTMMPVTAAENVMLSGVVSRQL